MDVTNNLITQNQQSRLTWQKWKCHQQNKQDVIEGSLEVKLPTIWRDEKAVSREKSQKRKDQKKEDGGARKGRKVASVFSEKVGWLAAGAETKEMKS